MLPRLFTKLISWRVVLILAASTLLLQVVNVSLSLWLKPEHQESSIQEKTSLNSLFFHLDDEIYELTRMSIQSLLLREIIQSSVLDSSGEYKLAVGVIKSKSTPEDHRKRHWKEIEGDEEVTLVTQCSIDHLYLLPQLASIWKGPISVAIFLLAGEFEAGIYRMIHLQDCISEVISNVTFSVVYSINSPIRSSVPRTNELLTCSDLLRQQDKLNYNYSGVQYPNNLLRNVARKAANTKYIIVIDIDMVPSSNLHSSFLQYSLEHSTNTENTIHIIPSYEIKPGTPFPADKSQLLSLRNQKLARPFYQELCSKCQVYTNYSVWEGYLDREKLPSILKPAYEVLWKDPWEPFYISKANVPYYDERFRQYGFNRISQVCELHIAGYRFVVMTPGFLLHRGYKMRKSQHEGKEWEQEMNRILYRHFKSDLKNKYPRSPRRCY